MDEEGEQKPSAIKARSGGVLGPRAGSISSAQKAAATVLRRSTIRRAAESPRGGPARTAFRGTGRAIGGRVGRGGGAASASMFPIGQLANATGGPAEGSRANEATLGGVGRAQAGSQRDPGATQQAVPRLRPSAGVSRGGTRSPLFNIRGHLGVGAAEGRRSPRRMQQEEIQDESFADQQAGGLSTQSRPLLRPQSAARTRIPRSLAPVAEASTELEDADELTPAQIGEERQAALQTMPTFFGAGSSGPAAISAPGELAATSSAPPGRQAQSPLFAAGFLLKASSRAAWPGTPMSIASAQQSEQPQQHKAPERASNIFGRLGASGAPSLAKTQAAIVAQSASAVSQAMADASAKLQRSQRFGSSLQEIHVPAEPGSIQAASPGAPTFAAFRGPAAFRQASPEPMADDAEAEAGPGTMDEDNGGIQQGTIQGNCMDMCPASEIERRTRIEDISSFERIVPNRAETNTELAVKKFARNIEQKPENFRTMEALQHTMVHLRNIMDRQDCPLVEIHKFLWDRFRGVRQDLFVQGFEGPDAIKMYEEHIRFMILAEHELCEETTAAADQEAFNSHLNLEQINKALISLNSMYDKLRAKGTPLATEVEFRAYHLLTLIGTHGRYGYNAAEYQNALSDLCPEVLMHGEVQRVLAMQRALDSGAWVAFFRLATRAPYLQGCLAHMYFRGVRAKALTVVASTGSAPPSRGLEYSLEDLKNTLHLNSLDHAVELCEAVGLEIAVGADNIHFTMIPRGFKATSDEIPRRRSHAISAKAQPLRSQVAQSIVPDPQAAAHAQLLAQQQMERLQAWRAQQEAEAAARLQAQQQAEEAAQQQAATAAAQQRAAEEAAQRQRAAAEAAAERQAELLRQQQAAAAAERLRQEQERAAAEAARLEAERQRLQEEERQAEARARAAAADARRREEARRQAELAAKRAEEERLRREQLERERLEREHLCRQEEGLRAVARKRLWRLVRQAARVWTDAVRRAREARAAERAAEQRLLNALKRVNVGMHARPPRPFRAPGATASPEVANVRGPQRSAERTAAMRELLLPLDVPRLVGQHLAASNPESTVLYWKLVLLQGAAFALNSAQEWLRSKLSLDRDTSEDVPRAAVSSLHEALPFGGKRVIHACACDASMAVNNTAESGLQHLSDATAGAAAILLQITDDDDPKSAHQTLHALLGSLGTGVQVPLLVVSSSTSVAQADLEQWADGVVSSSRQLSYHIAEHQVISLAAPPSSNANRSLEQGLLWLAARAPKQPTLKARNMREAVREELRARTVALNGVASTPACWVAAFNEALAATEQLTAAAAASKAAAWRWPPPQCARREGTLPTDWHHPAVQASMQQVLRDLRLPLFPRVGPNEDNGQKVAQYVQDALGSAPVTSAGRDWRPVLSEAFARRLYALEAAELLPAVVLHEQRQRLLPPPSTPELQPAILPDLWIEPDSPPRKRKWTGSTGGNAAAKVAAHGVKAPHYSPGVTARVQLPLRMTAGAGPLRKSSSMEDLFADIPTTTAATTQPEHSPVGHRLAMLQREIEARLQRNQRIAQGLDFATDVSALPVADTKSSPEKCMPLPEACTTPGSTGQQPQSEIDKERVLTAFLERAVMSC